MTKIAQAQQGFLQAKEEARKRSNYTCQSCGKKEDPNVNLQGHQGGTCHAVPDNE